MPRSFPLAMLSLLSVGLAGCASDGPSASHREMLSTLERIAQESREHNVYLGIGPLAEFRRQWQALPPDGVSPVHWRVLRELAAHEMRIGENDRAIEHLGRAYAMQADLADMPAQAASGTVLALAVAWFRQGELQNCCAARTAESCIFPIRGGGLHGRREPVQTAIGYLDEVLRRAPAGSPDQLTARWLRNLAAMTLGDYPDGLPPDVRIEPEALGSEARFPRFPNVAGRAGVDTFDLAGGAVAEDFDGDGRLDLMVSTSDPSGPMRYYANRGGGSFEERTEQAGLTGLTGGLNMIQADYDNDGDVDVLVLRGGWWRQLGRHPNSLLRNDGRGRFEDVTFEVGLGEVHHPTQTAAWADYDLDGDLDLYVGNENDPQVPALAQLFRNEGGRFTDVAAELGVTNDRYAKGVVWGDYDRDGDPDLYVSNLHQPNRLYRNDGGRFTDVAVELGVTGPIASFPAWFWDYDNDGDLDLFVTAYGPPGAEPAVWQVVAGYLGLPQPAELPHLYRNDGAGGFDEVGRGTGWTRPSLPMGANFGDIDSDGFLDVYLGTGYPFYEGLTPNELHRNVGGVRFEDVTWPAGVGHLQKGHGVVFADLDNDGDVDLFEQVGGQFSGDAFANALFENPGNGHHWLMVKLTGTTANRSGVGAELVATVADESGERMIVRHAGSGGSFGANPLHRQHLGLGAATRVRTLEVRWPGSGEPQVFRDLEVDRYVEIEQGNDELRELPYPR